MTDALSVAVLDALSGAIVDARARLERGIAEAERELAAARARSKELRRTLAVARARAGFRLEAPEPIDIPDLDLSALEAGVVPGLMRSYRDVPAEAVTAPLTAPERRPRRSVTSGPPREITSWETLPRVWRSVLGVLGRGRTDRLPDVIARNVILRWEGDNPLAGTRLGDTQALPILERLAASVEPRSAVVESVHATEGNVELLVRLAFVGDIPDHVRLETKIRCVFRFDDEGRIALLLATPDEIDVVDGFLILVEEGDPDATEATVGGTGGDSAAEHTPRAPSRPPSVR